MCVVAPAGGWSGLYILFVVLNKHAPYIIYYKFYLGTCTEKFTVYLISRIRCNNIHISILLHLILEIRYTAPSMWMLIPLVQIY